VQVDERASTSFIVCGTSIEHACFRAGTKPRFDAAA